MTTKTTMMMMLAMAALVVEQGQGFAPFLSVRSTTTTTPQQHQHRAIKFLLHSTVEETEFKAFADSLDDDEIANPSTPAAATTVAAKSWQESLEQLLDPTTPLTKRQILLNDLLGSNQEIRSSVEQALRDRTIDPLLTPTGKKLQDGTAAVARQLRTDILPKLAEAAQEGAEGVVNNRGQLLQPPSFPSNVGQRVFDVVSSQARKNLELLQQDLQNPQRIPERISKQTQELANEARNAFLETPLGLNEPPYKLVEKEEGYEIRDYAAYNVACTNYADYSGGGAFSLQDFASGGMAFNTLASYLFGDNQEERSLSMTTPVTISNWGEMRFYLDTNEPMTPKDHYDNIINNDNNKNAKVELKKVPAARLAVASFTGFVTDGEVARQKDALLSRLAMDGYVVDVPHGAIIPYLVFQYNPPYTLPMVRRNEIAVPIVKDPNNVPMSSNDIDISLLERQWRGDDYELEEEIVINEEAQDDISPSDVE